MPIGDKFVMEMSIDTDNDHMSSYDDIKFGVC